MVKHRMFKVLHYINNNVKPLFDKGNVSQGLSKMLRDVCHVDLLKKVPVRERDVNATTDSAKLRYVRRFNERA